jgi:hypothetical protein
MPYALMERLQSLSSSFWHICDGFCSRRLHWDDVCLSNMSCDCLNLCDYVVTVLRMVSLLVTVAVFVTSIGRLTVRVVWTVTCVVQGISLATLERGARMQEHAEEFCLVLLQMQMPDTYCGSLDGISVVLQALLLRPKISSRATGGVCVLPAVSVVGNARSTVSVMV